MKKLIISAFCLLLASCGNNTVEEELGVINEKLQAKEELSSRESCIADQLVSSIVDRKNIMLYAATFDLLSRVYIQQKAQQISFCRTMIIGYRSGTDLESAVKDCPIELQEMTNDQLVVLDDRARLISQAAGDLKNTITDQVIGSCMDL